MRTGAPMIPSTVSALMKTSVRVATLLARRQAEASPSVAMRREKVVTKAVESAPSAKRSRNMFGARNAVRNASMLREAPKSDAKTTSRSKPRRREHKMAMPTTPVARVLTRLFSGAAMRKTEQLRGSFRKQNLWNVEALVPSACRLGSGAWHKRLYISQSGIGRLLLFRHEEALINE